MVDVLVRISPRQETVIRVEETRILAGGWRQSVKEQAAVLMGWTIFDMERARIGLRPEDKLRLIELCKKQEEDKHENHQRRPAERKDRRPDLDCVHDGGSDHHTEY